VAPKFNAQHYKTDRRMCGSGARKTEHFPLLAGDVLPAPQAIPAQATRLWPIAAPKATGLPGTISVAIVAQLYRKWRFGV